METNPNFSGTYNLYNTEKTSSQIAREVADFSGSDSLAAGVSVFDKEKDPLIKNKDVSTIEPTKSLTERIITVLKKVTRFIIKAASRFFVYTVSKLSHCYHHLSYRRINPVRTSVEESGGRVSFKFSQIKGQWLGKMLLNRKTNYGHCYGLTAHWIVHRAKGDNLFHTIYDGPEKGKINDEVFETIRLFQEQQRCDSNYDNLMRENGIHAESEKLRVTATSLRQKQKDFVESLADSIVANSQQVKNRHIFKSIYIKGVNPIGHVMGVHLNKENNTICFFDPDFGEFTFNNEHEFKQWFVNHYWSKSGRNDKHWLYYKRLKPMNECYAIRNHYLHAAPYQGRDSLKWSKDINEMINEMINEWGSDIDVL